MIHALTRRTALAVAGIALLAPSRRAAAAESKRVALELVAGELALQTGAPQTPVWRFAPADALRFAQGDQAELTVANRLPVEAVIHWRGLDGAATLEPLLARPSIPPGGSASYVLSFVHAGTMICEAWLASQHTALPLLPIIVAEKVPADIDRDVVLLIEEWRPTSEGGAQPIYTVNGQSVFALEAAPNERLRLRFINGSQSSVIAVQLYDRNARVLAIDGQPSEPFLARDGRLVMASGTRIDAVVDIAAPGPSTITLNNGVRSVALGSITVSGAPKRPQPLATAGALPSNGLPEQLPLQSALRVDVPLDTRAPWIGFSQITTASQPTFRVKRGRPVVLALRNPGDATTTFQLHGHHMRLLDRLDDGWKPFWLDTVAVPARQTVRVAFGATNAGAYLMEMRTSAWGGQRLAQSYRVDG